MRYLLSFFLILCISCNCFKKQDSARPKATVSATSLVGTSWTLISIPGFDLEQTRKPVTLDFGTDNKIGGNAGCNHYGGSYSLQGEKISFSKIISTKMACLPGMKTENKFMEVLHNANEIAVSGDHLLLMQSGKSLAEFSRQ